MNEPEILMSYLLSAANENSAAIADSLEKVLTDRISLGTEDEALFSLELTSRLGWPLHTIARTRREVFESWESAASRIFDNCSNRIAFLSTKYFSVCCEAVWRGKVSVRDLINCYGFEGLFRRTYFTLFPEENFAPLLIEFINELRSAIYPSEQARKFVNWIEGLKEISQIALVSQPPLIIHTANWLWQEQNILVNSSLIKEDTQHDPSAEALNLDNEALLGVFILMALSLELFSNERVDVVQRHLANILPVLVPLRSILIARLAPEEIDSARAAIDACNFTEEQQEFIQRWMRKEFNLTLLETSREEGDEEVSNLR